MSEEIINIESDYDTLKEENKKLKKEINYLRQIKDALDKTIIISKTDTKGIITDVNPMFEKISGYTKDELINKNHNIVRHPDMPKSLFKKLWSTIKSGKIFKGVIKNRKKNGDSYYVLANVIPIKDEKGNIIEYIAIRQDITKRMLLLEEKEKFTNSLIKYFLNKLKEPTLVINKNSDTISQELQKESPDLETIKKANLEIKKEGLILKRSYEVLFFILKIKSKNIKLSIEPLKVTSILKHLCNKFAPVYPQKKIDIKFLKKDLIINTDKTLFILMLEILLMNALTYSKSEVKVEVFLENSKPFITIDHDGEPIKNPQKIFDFFNQIKNSQNVGMGMFLVKKICDILGYDIKIKKTKIFLELRILPPKF